jgi:DNA-3-methyladenine glycosylase I
MFERQGWMQRAGDYPETERQWNELLARAVMSAGLGPKVVESRWETMSDLFYQWEPDRVAAMTEGDVARLLRDPGAIRNRRKIEAVIANSKTLLDAAVFLEGDFGGFVGSLVGSGDLEGAAESLSHEFRHLGRTSALFLLWSAGYRPAVPA